MDANHSTGVSVNTSKDVTTVELIISAIVTRNIPLSKNNFV